MAITKVRFAAIATTSARRDCDRYQMRGEMDFA
jgi:hypothetical protein